jgi:hypothetical protein
LDINGQKIRVGWRTSLPMRVFVCPLCDKPKYKLSYVGTEWACRQCHGLDWSSRYRWRSEPRRARIEWLRRQIGADPRPGAQIPEKSLLNLKHLRLAIELRDLEDGLAGYTERGVSMVKRRRDDRRNCGDDTEGRRIATTMQSCG